MDTVGREGMEGESEIIYIQYYMSNTDINQKIPILYLALKLVNNKPASHLFSVYCQKEERPKLYNGHSKSNDMKFFKKKNQKLKLKIIIKIGIRD